jgi:hypothetical protein
VNPQVEVRDEDVEGGVTVMSDLVTGPKLPEVEVDRIEEPPTAAQGVPMVVIRVNETVEDMSFVQGGRAERYSFEAGTRYRVPIYIARELENIGKIWH